MNDRQDFSSGSATVFSPGAAAASCAASPTASRAAHASGGAAQALGVQVDDLHCHFNRVHAVNGVSFRVRPGEHIAITGANGSGKSTLLRALIGLHRPSSGDIRINGASVCHQPALARQLCAWVPQRQAVGRFPLRVHELLASGGALDSAARVAEQLGIGHLLQRPLSSLSGGQLQRAFIARAIGSLSQSDRLLLADEPTAALDFAGQQEIAALIAALPGTAIVVTHDRGMAAACDRVFEMAAGSLREVKR